MVILVLIGARRAPLLLIIALTIVASHSMIARKTYRFVFPALPFFLTLAAIGTALVTEYVTKLWPAIKQRYLAAAAIAIWGATSSALSVSDHFRPNLYRRAAEIAAFVDLRDMASTCAVGLINVRWWETGGYTYLHRDIPIYLVESSGQLPAMRISFNTALAPADEPLETFGYRRDRCYAQHGSISRPLPELCLFVRDGGCVPQPELALNPLLLRSR
jgi:GPI mannosyltransferase 3